MAVREPRSGTMARPLVDQAAMRLSLLDQVGDDLSDVALLSFALQHAVADMGGLGGMAHRCGKPERTLQLAAASGLPRELAEKWEEIHWGDPAAPAQAVREDRMVWMPPVTPEKDDVATRSSGPDATGEGASPPRPAPPGPVSAPPPEPLSGLSLSERSPRFALAAGSGLIAVPLKGPDGPLGVLSVLTSDEEAPGTEEREFLIALAAGVSERLARARPAPPLLRPAWWQVPTGAAHLEQRARPTTLGAWEWEIGTGRLLADDAALEMGGIAREDYDERIDTWNRLIHPDDAPVVSSEIERAVSAHSAYSVEFRILRPNGDLAWLESRACVTYDDDGRPRRMTGTIWESTETRLERDSLRRALRYMSDGFIALDEEWRILYCNVEAERALEPPTDWWAGCCAKRCRAAGRSDWRSATGKPSPVNSRSASMSARRPTAAGTTCVCCRYPAVSRCTSPMSPNGGQRRRNRPAPTG